MDYVIELSSFGVSLRFNPILQILTSIRFSKMDEVVLQYPMGSSGQVTVFSMPKKVATVGDIYQTFGPTTPGRYENDYRHFVLEYPGLAFVFAVPVEKSQLYSVDSSAVPRENVDSSPNLSLPLASLYCRPSAKESQISTREDALRALETRPRVEVYRGASIVFTDPNTYHSTSILFGTHVQEVIAALGVPDQRFTKPPSAFNSSKQPHPASTVLPETDYFFNYFDYGVDILFDGRLHVVKKFVLWTNLPSQPDFVRYSKCHYLIETRGISADSRSSSSSNIRSSSNAVVIPPPAQNLLLAPEDLNRSSDEVILPINDLHQQKQQQQRRGGKDGNRQRGGNVEEEEEQEEIIVGGGGGGVVPASPPHRKSSLDASDNVLVPSVITPEMKWSEIEAIMGQPSGNPYWFPTREGAFGGMTYFAYPNIVFEVMKKDQYVSKIFLFPD